MAKKQKISESALAAASWWKSITESSNAAFLPLMFCESRYLVLRGGAGSGKSIFAGRKIIERCMAEGGHRFLVCRKVARTIPRSCFDQLCGQIAQFYPDADIRINRTSNTIEFPTGSKIFTAGLDDPEKLKSIYEITDLWIEEASELKLADFNQLDIRCRGVSGHYQQIIISFNPVSITHWLKARFFDAPDPLATVSNTTYRDNRFLPEGNRAVLEGFKDSDPYYYMVYCLNQWGVTGNTVFNREAIAQRLSEIQPVLDEGCYEYRMDGERIASWHWVSRKGGSIRIHHRPQKGVPYVIGGDTAGTGSDDFTAQCIDNRDGTQMAVLQQKLDEDEYACQMYCLGMDYGEALLAIECNYSSYPNKKLDSLGYRNLYVRQREDSYTGSIRDSYGVRTDKLTRPVMLAELKAVMRERIDLLSDRPTLEQMLAFIRTDRFREEAEQGEHDDLVMALAIAFYARPQQRYTLAEKAQSGRNAWTNDMFDDYRAADAAERQYLLKKWGAPSNGKL